MAACLEESSFIGGGIDDPHAADSVFTGVTSPILLLVLHDTGMDDFVIFPVTNLELIVSATKFRPIGRYTAHDAARHP